MPAVTGTPLLLDLTGRRVVVVGGGAVGTRRVRMLLDAGATVEVIAPAICAELAGIDVCVHRRAFVAGDLDGAWLAMACTDDPAVNRAVGDAAAQRRIFCVRADDAPAGTARVPAVLRHGQVTVAVNGGDDPRRASALRDAIGLALDLGELTTHPVRRAGANRGSVALVGGGPGAGDLITVRGRRLVAEADVVVVDRLAPRELLETLPDDVEIVDCGKAPHRQNLSQDDINKVLVDRASAGKRVVRLKGGDPFVFGRGGEELLACVEAGVPVTVVPGISSALAAPAAAGIPLTHRRVAADFTVVSGHLDPGRAPDDDLDWRALARGSSTLVLLMSMDRLSETVGHLLAHGRDPKTPAAVIHRATLPGQRILRSPLSELVDAVAAADLGPPSVVVVGDVVDVLPDPAEWPARGLAP